MLNRLLNSATAWYVQRSFRSYHHYPADKTAVVFIDVQNALIAAAPALTESLGSLARLARTQGFLVIHAKMAASSDTRHPTPALIEIERLLSGEADSSDIAAAIGPVYADVVLPERSTLSIFGSSEVDELIDSHGL